jgi:hypothetical protein
LERAKIMTGDAVIILSFLIYLTFFGWLGWRRGARREIIVFCVALLGWLLMQEQGDIFVNVANLGAAALAFARAGGFSGNAQEALAAIGGAEQLVTDATRQAYLFMLWLAIFVLTYILTNTMVQDKNSVRNGWAVLFGVLNGLFFALAFLPSLLAMFAEGGAVPAPDGTVDVDLSMILSGVLRLLWNGIAGMWTLVLSFGSLGLLLMLTLLLVLAASTIRGGAKAKS